MKTVSRPPGSHFSLGRTKQALFGSNSINVPLGTIAIIVLLGSLCVLIYNDLSEEDTDTLVVNGKEYTWVELFDDFSTVTMDGNEGIRLSDIMNDTGLEDPGSHGYRIIAADGYTKTVSWDDMQNGIIQESKETYFSDLPKQFYVRDVNEIEVI